MYIPLKRTILTIFILLLVATPLVYVENVYAQQVAQLTPAERAQLEAELKALEAELAQKQKELAGQKNQSSTLAGEIKRLTSQVSAKKTEISLKNKKITQLSTSIVEKETAIQSLSERIKKEKQSLAQLIRKTNEMDQETLTSFLLSSESLSTFYSDVSRYDTLKKEVKGAVDTIQEIKGVTEVKKGELEKDKSKTLDEKKRLEQIQRSIEADKANQNKLLSISKNKEVEYQKIIAEQQKKVGEIKARLFQLAGGAQAIRFDVALGYAKSAQAKTGVDAALVLAILTQESNLGANVGKCYLTNTETGESTNVNSGKVYSNGMKPSRDVAPFIEITGNLGYDWKKTVVSCPIAGVAGYGGAMGPAQFIPSTWKLFEKRLAAVFGRPSNPWNAEDAFMASSMYLADLGGAGGYSSQVKAACKYYGSGGTTCSYGRSVMSHRDKIQADIDYLNEYGVSRR